jgi:hypothetical protein
VEWREEDERGMQEVRWHCKAMLAGQKYQSKFWRNRKMKWTLHVSRVIICSLITASAAFAGVSISAPSNNSKVGTSVQFIATSESPSCSKGVSSMGIYTAPGKLVYTTQGSKLNTSITLGAGTYNAVVQEWDGCGWSAKKQVTITVGSGGSSGGSSPAPPSGANVFSNLQADKNWNGYALLPPGYGICDSCTSTNTKASWSTAQGVSSPSLSGKSMKFSLGGNMSFGDILWNQKFTTRLADQKSVPNYHQFTYDVYFYIADASVSQALEFDINQFINGKSYIWGHECRIAGGHEWDTWNNQTMHWVKSGIPCNPKSGAWNHLVIQAERTSDDHIHFISITLNDVTSKVDRYDTPTKTTWYGMTINYQMDGNSAQKDYSVYLDKLNFYYK